MEEELGVPERLRGLDGLLMQQLREREVMTLAARCQLVLELSLIDSGRLFKRNKIMKMQKTTLRDLTIADLHNIRGAEIYWTLNLDCCVCKTEYWREDVRSTGEGISQEDLPGEEADTDEDQRKWQVDGDYAYCPECAEKVGIAQ